jgi:hypothetical protein
VAAQDAPALRQGGTPISTWWSMEIIVAASKLSSSAWRE